MQQTRMLYSTILSQIIVVLSTLCHIDQLTDCMSRIKHHLFEASPALDIVCVSMPLSGLD